MEDDYKLMLGVKMHWKIYYLSQNYISNACSVPQFYFDSTWLLNYAIYPFFSTGAKIKCKFGTIENGC